MSPSPRIREVYGDGDELEEEEEDDDVLADFAFERGTGIVGGDHRARGVRGKWFARRQSGRRSFLELRGRLGVAATMAVARMMSATGAKSLPQGLVRLMSPYQAHYDELKMLGKGGFGCVVAAVGRLDDRPVAVKKIHFKSAAPPWAKNDAIESLHEELLREARALALMDDPRVVKYHSAWIEPRWSKLASMSGDAARRIRRRDGLERAGREPRRPGPPALAVVCGRQRGRRRRRRLRVVDVGRGSGVRVLRDGIRRGRRRAWDAVSWSCLTAE